MEFNRKTLRNVFLGVAGCILLYWLLHETERVTAFIKSFGGVFSPFIVGAVLAFVLNVPMRAIERLLNGITQPNLRRAMAILLTIVAIILVLSAVVWLLIPQINTTLEQLLPTLLNFFTEVQEKALQILNDNPKLKDWLIENTEFEHMDWGGLIQNVIGVIGDSLGTILDKTIAAIGSFSTGIFNAVVSLVFGLYCLSRKELLARQGRRLLYAFLPEKVSDVTVRVLRLTNSTFSNFISGQCVEAVILGGLFAVAMLIFKMPYIPLICVIISVTALVPIVGAFVGCIVGAFFILVDNPIQAVWFVVMFLVIQQLEGNLIYPRVVGSSVGLPGMWVLVAVAVGGDLMGVGGMLLMIPLSSVCYALLKEITNARLANRAVHPSKLEAQPPELTSKFKEKRKQSKEKWQMKKAAKKQEKEQSESSK